MPLCVEGSMAPMTSSLRLKRHEFFAFGRPNHPAVKNSHAFVPKNAWVVALATTNEVPTSISEINDFRRRFGAFDFFERGGILAVRISTSCYIFGVKITITHIRNEGKDLFERVVIV